MKALKQRQKELQNASLYEVAKMRDLANSKEALNNNNNNTSTNNNNLRNGQAGTPSPPMLPAGSNQQCLPHPNVNCGPGSGNSMMMGPNIHQMQQLIQQQLLTPAQLQSLMQQQTLLFQHQVNINIQTVLETRFV